MILERRYSGGNNNFERQIQYKIEELKRQAINTGIQGGGSDVVSRATINIHRELAVKKLRAGLVISHHDALYVETPISEVFEAAEIMTREMTREVPELFNMVFPVELHVGPRWGLYDKPLQTQVIEYLKEKGMTRSLILK
jgi:DNA polymerase I-like protein with 3'-5' exonuclease and polymerase domains